MARRDLQQQAIDEFRANAGQVGGYFTAMPLLLLVTTGAKSGRQRTTLLSYTADDGRYVVVAANAGAPRHPDWYHNLVANPDVTIEVGSEVLDVTATVLSGGERETLYQRFAGESPQVMLYQSSTTRQFPVVALTPRDAP
ncbi:nitroreductase family deazaflavin-dependent oxidoreductase [Kibdelosporangium lantanae]